MKRTIILVALICLGLCGCSSEDPNKASSPDEVKAFKGSAPPPEVSQRMKEGMAKSSGGAKVIQ